MALKKYSAVVTLIFLLSSISCGNKPKQTDLPTYHQDFSDNVVVITIERNGVLWKSSSAFVIDREKGLLFTAKHTVGVGGKDKGKIFLNGRVYDGMLVQTPATIDAGGFKITSRFNPQNLPESYKIGSAVKKGDRVFIKGIHPHAPDLQEEKMLVPIYSDHYRMPWTDNEYTLDILEASVVNPSMTGTYNMGKRQEDGGQDIAGVYIHLKTKEDHKFSFGGLSGGPVVNERDELIGIVAQEIQAHYELSQSGLKYHPWETVFVVPISQLTELGLLSTH